MINSNIFLIISIIMFIIMAGFLIYASRHPELSFPIGTRLTYFIYLVYIFIMLALFILSIFANN